MNYDDIILGEGCKYTTNSLETQLNNNVIVVGGSGSGKSMSYSESCLLKTKNSSLIVKLSKRKLIDKYTPLYESRAYDVKVLDLVNPAKSNVAFDPLYYIKSETDAVHLAKTLVKLDPEKSKPSSADPYWDESATLLVYSLILLALAMDENASLSSVIRYIKNLKISDDYSSSISTNLDSTFNAIEEERPDHPAVTAWRSFSQLPPKTARCIYGTLISALDAVFTPGILEMMDKENKIDFQETARKKTIIFVLTSAVSPAIHSFANLFFAYAIKELFEFAEEQPNGKPPVPLHLLCDDFAVGGCIEKFQEYISIFREKQIRISMLLQSESQLVSMYGEDNATTIINNCDTYVYMGGMDLRTCNHISQRANLPLEDILYMPIARSIIFRRGQKPIFTNRYNITENPLYREITAQFESKTQKEDTGERDFKSFLEQLNPAHISNNGDSPEDDLRAELEAKFDELFGNAS